MPKGPLPPKRATRPMLRRVCEEVEATLGRNNGFKKLFRISAPRAAESFEVKFFGYTAHSACLAFETILSQRGMKFRSDLSIHEPGKSIVHIPIHQDQEMPRIATDFLAPTPAPPPTPYEAHVARQRAREASLTGKVEKMDTQSFLASDEGKKFLAEQAERDAKRKAGRK